jgi:type II secretory pathway pseudopilin PulG
MRGYSLVEVLVATLLVAAGVAGLAQLVALSGAANRHAKQTTMAAVLAQQKMEELVAAAADVGADVELLDRDGHLLEAGAPPGRGSYVRRWSVDPLSGASAGARLLQVAVTDQHGQPMARLVTARSGEGF